MDKKEIIEKLSECKSAEEIMDLAKEHGIEKPNRDKAQKIYDMLHGSIELSEQELNNVSGGSGCNKGNFEYYNASNFPSTNVDYYLFKLGDTAYINRDGAKTPVVINDRKFVTKLHMYRDKYSYDGGKSFHERDHFIKD